MFIELIDALRCPQPHDQTWLVASITERDDRMIRSGTLGCPICAREYPLREGVVWFGLDPEDVGADTHRSESARATESDAGDASDAAMMLGAFLGAAEGATIAVTGQWADAAVALTQVLPLRVYVVNASHAIANTERVGYIRSGEGIPLAANALRGVALDPDNATPREVASAIRALAPGGRLVAPADIAIPPELAEIARDEQWWVAEKQRPLVSLRRR